MRGRYVVQLTVNDGRIGSTPAIVNVDVIDNRPPIAEAGADQVISVGGDCLASATLNGTGSTDPDGDVLTYTWTGPFGSINGSIQNVHLSLGTYNITLIVNDGWGGTASDTVNITVTDRSPPSIKGLIAAPSLLWPPNHKMVDVAVDYNAIDNCGQPACQISSVTSNEPISNSDYVIVDAHHVKLSADRLGAGTGRIYTITIGCMDPSRNPSNQAVIVTVPHDQGKK
jgi:hypothetical protein